MVAILKDLSGPLQQGQTLVVPFPSLLHVRDIARLARSWVRMRFASAHTRTTYYSRFGGEGEREALDTLGVLTDGVKEQQDDNERLYTLERVLPCKFEDGSFRPPEAVIEDHTRRH